MFHIIRIAVCLCYGITLCSQDLPDMVFRNIEIWADRYGAIQVLEDSKGNLWMTSAMGVHRYDGKHVYSYFQQPDTLSISANYTEMLFEDRDHNVWIGTTKGGIDRYTRTSDQFVRVVSSEAGIGHAVRMIQDPAGTLWICGANGLFALDPMSVALIKFTPDMPPKDPAGYGFRGLAQDRTKESLLWVAGLDGAYQFDKASHTFVSLDVPGRAGGSYMLMDIHELVAGDLWSASWSGGLMHRNGMTCTWEHYFPEDLEDGRWYDVVKGILPANDRKIWVAGGAGFGQFDIPTATFSFYPFEENTQAIDSSFSFAGICTTRQGSVIVTGLKGFSIGSPGTGAPGKLFFPPGIQALEIEGKPFSADTALAELSHIYLDAREKNIALTLITPGNYSHEPVEFTYRMEGYEKDWQVLHDGRTVRYTNLPRGSYRFLYRARIGQQEWIEGRPLRVEKEIVFFMQAWFRVLSGSAAVALILLFYKLRVDRIRNEEKLKTEFNKKLADTEMAVLRTQMNPHFMFNSLNSIKYYILNEETDNASKYLTKFSMLMRLVLKNSQSRLVNLSDELEALRLYIELESLRFKEEFTFRFYVDPEVDQEDTFIPPLIIQPYVENAIWHGLLQKQAPGKLDVHITCQNGYVQVEVTDDGIGREAAEALRSKSATKKSFGTQITRDRIALVREIIGMDATVTTHDQYNGEGKATGTRIVIRIPRIQGEEAEAFNRSE